MKKLLVDVDGVLAPMTDDENGLNALGFLPVPNVEVWYHPDHGRMLTEFAREHDFELTWCTYWGDGANEILAPLLGVDEWPVIDLATTDMHAYFSTWKYEAVAAACEGIALAWFDDEHGTHLRGDRYRHQRNFLQQRTAPTKLVAVDRHLGLGKRHLDEIAEWVGMIEA